MNKLLQAVSAVVLYTALSFPAEDVIASPDKIAASLADAVDDINSTTAAKVVRTRVEEDFSDLVSQVVLTGTAQGGSQGGKTLSQIFSGMRIEERSLFTSPHPTSLQVASCVLSKESGNFDWRTVNRLTVALSFNAMPSPDYTATYTLKVPGIKASGQLRFSMDEMAAPLKGILPGAIGMSGMNLTLETVMDIQPPAHVRALLDTIMQLEHFNDDKDSMIAYLQRQQAGHMPSADEINSLELAVARAREALHTANATNEETRHRELQRLEHLLAKAVATNHSAMEASPASLTGGDVEAQLRAAREDLAHATATNEAQLFERVQELEEKFRSMMRG